MGKKSVDEILHDAAELFKLKNEGYGNAYKRQPKILHELLGEVTLKTPNDYARFLRVTSVITKLNRYCTSFAEGGHLDSAHDLTVFAAMLQELAEEELEGEAICETKSKTVAMPHCIRLKGMTGMGDSIHQIAAIKHFAQMGINVVLETPFPQFYQDYPNVQCVPLIPIEGMFKNFRTSEINMSFSKDYYCDADEVLQHDEDIHITYNPQTLRQAGSFVGAIVKSCGIPPSKNNLDFTISGSSDLVNESIDLEGVDILEESNKPILVYKPITYRAEFKYSDQRNPDHVAYEELIKHIIKKDLFTVVSIANLKDGEEEIVGSDIDPHVEWHNGELSVGQLCTLVHGATLVFCPPGFLLPMAQSVMTPSICVYGGRESSSMYEDGAVFTPSLGIDTINPCNCFDAKHKCVKEINIESAKSRIDDFLEYLKNEA